MSVAACERDKNGKSFCHHYEAPVSKVWVPKRMPKHLDAFLLVFEMAPGKMDVPYVNGAHGVVVSHPLSMREALGSIPSVSIFAFSQSINVVFSARMLKENLHKVVKDFGQPHLGLGGSLPAYAAR